MSLDVKDLSFSYGSHQVLHGVTFAAKEGENMTLLGPNGVGKSTLFRCILGLLPGYTGEVLLHGRPLRGLRAAALARHIAYVPQSHYPSFNYSVQDMVLMGTTAQVGSLFSPGTAQKQASREALERLGIAHLRHRGYMHISGGERQLVLIARALAQNARVLVMDEPTANLDYGNSLRVLEQIRTLAAEGYTILQSSHNPDHAFLFAHRVLALQAGRVAACGPPAEVLTPALIRDLYGVDVQVEHLAGGVTLCVPQVNMIHPTGGAT